MNQRFLKYLNVHPTLLMLPMKMHVFAGTTSSHKETNVSQFVRLAMNSTTKEKNALSLVMNITHTIAMKKRTVRPVQNTVFGSQAKKNAFVLELSRKLVTNVLNHALLVPLEEKEKNASTHVLMRKKSGSQTNKSVFVLTDMKRFMINALKNAPSDKSE